MENNAPKPSPTEAAGYIAGVGLGLTRCVGRKLAALVLFNLGVFLAIAAFLPRAASYSSTGIVSEFINSRLHWDIAVLATLASTCITTGAVVLFSGKGQR